MFLRIEGFQVEIKEINKTWDHAAFVKNFKIGKFEKQNIVLLQKIKDWVYFWIIFLISAKSSIYNLEGLKPNTFYHVRSKSRNKAGLRNITLKN